MAILDRKKFLGIFFAAVLTFVCASDLLSADAPVRNDVLRKIFPDLMNARLTELKDLTDLDQQAYKEYGYSFWLRGDFNQDGYEDVAIAGRFDNPHNPNDQTFVAILSYRKGSWIKEYYLRPPSRVVTLEVKPHPDPEKNKRGLRAIVALFSGWPSDDYAVIYWNGKSYQAFSGFDLLPPPRFFPPP